MDKIEKYASGNYKSLLDMLTDEADAHAEGLEAGGIIIRLEAVSSDAQIWLGGGQHKFTTVTRRTHLGDAKSSALDNAIERQIEGVLRETLSLPEREFYDDEYVFSAGEFGRSICFTINEHGGKETSLKVVVLACCDGNHEKEREICFALRPIVKDWCAREKKCTPLAEADATPA